MTQERNKRTTTTTADITYHTPCTHCHKMSWSLLAQPSSCIITELVSFPEWDTLSACFLGNKSLVLMGCRDGDCVLIEAAGATSSAIAHSIDSTNKYIFLPPKVYVDLKLNEMLTEHVVHVRPAVSNMIDTLKIVRLSSNQNDGNAEDASEAFRLFFSKKRYFNEGDVIVIPGVPTERQSCIGNRFVHGMVTPSLNLFAVVTILSATSLIPNRTSPVSFTCPRSTKVLLLEGSVGARTPNMCHSATLAAIDFFHSLVQQRQRCSTGDETSKCTSLTSIHTVVCQHVGNTFLLKLDAGAGDRIADVEEDQEGRGKSSHTSTIASLCPSGTISRVSALSETCMSHPGACPSFCHFIRPLLEGSRLPQSTRLHLLRAPTLIHRTISLEKGRPNTSPFAHHIPHSVLTPPLSPLSPLSLAHQTWKYLCSPKLVPLVWASM